MTKFITTASPRADLGGLHYTIAHTGKMTGLQSLSTSVSSNPICQARAKDVNSICSRCFAAAMMQRYNSLDRRLSDNLAILSGSVLPSSVLPLIPVKYFRFESFGDLASVNQVINYFNIAKKNRETLCALWTKNPQFIAKAIKMGHEKPKNLQIVLSSPELNKPINKTRFAFVDKIFTVYDKQHAGDVVINCGARSCLACGRCYRSNPNGSGVEYVNELLK